jgi:hypothetical protein
MSQSGSPQRTGINEEDIPECLGLWNQFRHATPPPSREGEWRLLRRFAYADNCPRLAIVIDEKLAVSSIALDSPPPSLPRYQGPVRREVRATVGPPIPPPSSGDRPIPLPQDTKVSDVEVISSAYCGGPGLGWIEVAENQGRVSFSDVAPTAGFTPGVVPKTGDRLNFTGSSHAALYRSARPCVFQSQTACGVEPMTGRFRVAGRYVFSDEVGGRRRWRLCLVGD